MVSPNVQIIRKDGKEQFVVLPYEEFLEIQERLHDAEDLLDLRKAKQAEGEAPTMSLDEVQRLFAADERE
jgi:predicted AAA+ superfamily ATPase